MTQFYATSFISAWHFLHERLWVRSKPSFCKLFLAAGEARVYCDFLPVCLGNRKKAQETLVKIA